MYKLSTAIYTAATVFLLFTSPPTWATKLLIIDESLGTLPTDYLLYSSATANATADFQLGSLGASNGLIFDASWNVPANGSEDSLGLMYPEFLSFEIFQVDPREIEGITSVHWTLDTEVISSTMSAPEQGIFAQLVIYQLQGNNSILSFTNSRYVITGQSVSLDITAIESDFGPLGGRPDFSAAGLPMVFGLQLGARYPKTNNPQAFFVDGRMTAKNWTVSVTDSGGIFSDSFEAQTSNLNEAQGISELSDEENCLCPAPVPASVMSPPYE